MAYPLAHCQLESRFQSDTFVSTLSRLTSAKALAIIALPFVFTKMVPKQRPMITKYESTWGSGEPDAAPWRRSQEQWQNKAPRKRMPKKNLRFATP